MIKSLFHFLSHPLSPIVGFTRRLAPVNKKNNGGFYLEGLWILRSCNICGETFTRDGIVDMVGRNKFAVRVGPSMLFVEGCSQGCHPDDLYVNICDNSLEDLKAAHVEVGCNFCKRKITRVKVSSALSAWTAQQEKHP